MHIVDMLMQSTCCICSRHVDACSRHVDSNDRHVDSYIRHVTYSRHIDAYSRHVDSYSRMLMHTVDILVSAEQRSTRPEAWFHVALRSSALTGHIDTSRKKALCLVFSSSDPRH